MDTYVTEVARFGSVVHAHLAKARLEAAGIRAFLVDEQSVSVNPFYASALGGVKLWVRAEDAETAARLLAEERTLDQDE